MQSQHLELHLQVVMGRCLRYTENVILSFDSDEARAASDIASDTDLERSRTYGSCP